MKTREALSIFLSSLCFVIVVGLLLQLLVIPLSPWHAGAGLMQGGDWTGFHRLAIDLAASIRANGWGEWVLRVNGQAPASAAAALYVLTGIEQPWVLLPLHGILYGMAALALYSVARTLGLGSKASLLPIIPLFLFPSTAMVWGQIHKDIYSIAGIMLVFRYWIQMWKFSSAPPGNRFWVGLAELGLLSLGMGLILFVRPYLGEVVLLASLLAALILGLDMLIRFPGARRTGRVGPLGFGGALLVAALMVQTSVIAPTAVANSVAATAGQLAGVPKKTIDWLLTERTIPEEAVPAVGSEVATADEAVPAVRSEPATAAPPPVRVRPSCSIWSSSLTVPGFVDRQLGNLACTREGFRLGYPDAGSNIDTDVVFSDLGVVTRYLPRALTISLLAPFPNLWMGDAEMPGGRVMRMLIIPEMLILYAMLLGLLIALVRARARVPILMSFVFSLTIALTYTLVVLNMGTLYRARYAAMLIWMLLGLVGWAALWQERGQQSDSLDESA